MTVLITTFVFLLDRLSKWLVFRFLINQPFWITEDKLGLVFKGNEGIAFSLPIKGFFSIFLVLFLIGLVIWFAKKKLKKKLFLSSLVIGFVLGGALGNLVDRFFLGYVVDFIKIG